MEGGVADIVFVEEGEVERGSYGSGKSCFAATRVPFHGDHRRGNACLRHDSLCLSPLFATCLSRKALAPLSHNPYKLNVNIGCQSAFASPNWMLISDADIGIRYGR